MYVEETFGRWALVYFFSCAMQSAAFANFGLDHGAKPYVLAAWLLWLNPATMSRAPTFLDVTRWIIVVPLSALVHWAAWYTPYLSEAMLVATLFMREYPLGGSGGDEREWLHRLGDAVRQTAAAVGVAAYAMTLLYYAQVWHDHHPWRTYTLMTAAAWFDRLAVRPALRARLPSPRRCYVVYLHAWFALPWYATLYSLPNTLNVLLLHAVAPDTWSPGKDRRADAALWVQNLALGLGVAVGHLVWKYELVDGRTEYYGATDFLLRVLVSALFSFYFVAADKEEDMRERAEEARGRGGEMDLLIPSVLVLSFHVAAIGFLLVSALFPAESLPS